MAEPRGCLKVNCGPDNNSFSFGKGKRYRGLDLESMEGVARLLPPQTLETTLQFQTYVLVQDHVTDKHNEILPLDVVSGNIL